MQEAKTACTNIKETVSDLKQDSHKNLPSGADNAADQKPKRGELTLKEIANLKRLQQAYRYLHDDNRELLSIKEFCERRIRNWKSMGLTEDQVAEEMEK